MSKRVLEGIFCAVVLLSSFVSVYGEDEKKPSAVELAKQRKAEREAAKAKEREEQQKAAAEWYGKMVKAYMEADWTTFDEENKLFTKHSRGLTKEQRDDIAYVRGAAVSHRPTWWHRCRSSENVSFKASIWNKPFTANYMPSEMLGAMAPVGIQNGKLMVIVSWRPNYVDDPKKYSNDNQMGVYIEDAEKHKFTMAQMAEAIVWHELGHNYVSISLPLKHVITLYDRYGMLYTHMQEFFADLTALYHVSPPARVFLLKMRQGGFRHYDDAEPHTRGCSHGIGSLLLSKIMKEKEKWPSFHMPGKVPDENIERNVILYMYDQLPDRLTFHEERELREWLGKWARSKGNAVLRSKGKVQLENGQQYAIMANDDREYQPKRDQWVKAKIEELIKNKQTDDPALYDKSMEGEGRVIRVRIREIKAEDEKSKPKPRDD